MFSLSNIGMSYPGLNTNSKVHLYKTICQPTLMYGLDCLSLTKRNIDDVQATQGRIMKHVCGLGKRSRHSALLHALGISNAGNVISECTKSLFNRICSTDSPTRDLCFYFINLYARGVIYATGSLGTCLWNPKIRPTQVPAHTQIKDPYKYQESRCQCFVCCLCTHQGIRVHLHVCRHHCNKAVKFIIKIYTIN